MIGQDAFRRMHVGALALCAIFLPWSTAFLSMSQMLLVANWLAWGIANRDLKDRAVRSFTWPPALVFMSFFGLHLLGLLWTKDLGWGLDLCRILLPVLVFSVVLASSPRLQAPDMRTILLLGAWSVIINMVISLLVRGSIATDHRELSMFISHIRVALLLCLAIVVFLRYARGPWWLRIAHWCAVVFAVYALDRLQSVQGFIILAAIAFIWLWRVSERWSRTVAVAMRVIMILVPGLLLVWASREVRAFRTTPLPENAGWGEFTSGGEPYTFDATNPQRESGRHVWTWIAWGEVERTWRMRSDRPLDGNDEQGDPLRGTLVRYMTSLDLRKDSVGVMALSDQDVRAIEQGSKNAAHDQGRGLRHRMDVVLLELGQYAAYGRADGHSITQRLEYWRAGLAIARRHWAIGVGTGDTQAAFDAQYVAMGTSLAPQWRHRAHNQYLTLWISFGAFGLLWSLFSWWWPAWRLGAWRDPLFIAWAITFGISCLSDDTIETQTGVTFFVFYYALLVFAAPRQGDQERPASNAPST